ncbi:nucleotidyltransferase domain-containing protein [Cellulomonas sp. PhB150]|uniref:nucleotidyltransferase domain-containing protein n=1 Tax=Cellulomonas sp. PhB150 TaxID=2485188 RepID=UPI000F490F87|nr:nucleotidyltransferase domain-containing protein [Cellulomonas sp. PhB150]ROS23960.1 nucleotidyltransferase-like protein [Cellulomonas sp. PhB150]
MQLQHPLATVTPTLDGDVLTVLARARAKHTVGSIQHVLGDRSYEGVRKVLLRLSAQGVVQTERVGNVSSFWLNCDHLAAAAIIELAQLGETLITRIRDDLAGWAHPPVYAAVFGSALTGTMRIDSDIDVFIVRPDTIDADAWTDETDGLARRITAWTGNDARILGMSEREVLDGANSERVLLDIASARHGTVAGDPQWLRRLVGVGRSRGTHPSV